MDRMPSRTTIYVVHILPEEYPLFRAGLPRDTRLPVNYEEWYQATLRTHKIHRAAALDTKPVTVHWDDLVEYARRIRLPVTYALMTTFAIAQGHNHRRHGPPRL